MQRTERKLGATVRTGVNPARPWSGRTTPKGPMCRKFTRLPHELELERRGEAVARGPERESPSARWTIEAAAETGTRATELCLRKAVSIAGSAGQPVVDGRHARRRVELGRDLGRT